MQPVRPVHVNVPVLADAVLSAAIREQIYKPLQLARRN